MLDAGRHEEQVARREPMPLRAVPESAGASDYDVDLIPGVGFLRIVLSWSVQLDAQRPVAEQLDIALSCGARQAGERISNGELMLHAVRAGLVARRPMSRRISRAAL